MSAHISIFSLGEKQYTIQGEEELALILELLSSSKESHELHRYIFMTLDEELMKIISSYTGLLLCMKNLDHENRFLLLIKIGDALSPVIEKSAHLGSILAGIPEEADKIRIIKSIRTKGLIHMIHTPDDLGNILEWIFGDGERVVFEMLGKVFLESLFIYGTDIYKVFHFLSDTNKDILTDILTFPFIRSHIYSAEDFFYVLKALSNDKAGDFIKHFSSVEIQTIIGNNSTLHYYLPKITKEKEQALIQYLQS